MKKRIYKTKSARSVLQLMDKDVSYGVALRRIMRKNKVPRKKLEKQLDPFI